MGKQSAPLVLSLTAIAALTIVSAATTPRHHSEDPATTSAFEQLARRAGATIPPADAATTHTVVLHADSAVVAPPSPWEGSVERASVSQ